MELWIPITLAAAFLQNLRSTVQKHLKGVMGTTGATFVRFGFGLPFAALFLLALRYAWELPIPSPGTTFATWVVVGAVSQILGTFLLVHLFSFRNFAVGTAYSRTEPAQAAVFGIVFLGDFAGLGGMIGIAITVIGVMLISVSQTPLKLLSLIEAVFSRIALIGIAAGTFFGLSAVAYRAASLSLGGPHFLMQAATTLFFATLLQTVVMIGWMLWREPHELHRIAAAWKPSLFVGFVGASASFGWFSAMTLQQASIVKALAQVEMIFAFISSVFFFRERIHRMEIVGCLLILAGVAALMLFGEATLRATILFDQ